MSKQFIVLRKILIPKTKTRNIEKKKKSLDVSEEEGSLTFITPKMSFKIRRTVTNQSVHR